MKDTLQSLAEEGYVCGLQTLGEAVVNWEIHAVPCLPYAEIPAAVERVRAAIADQDLEQRCTDILGEARCKEIDKEMDAFFDGQHDDSGVAAECEPFL